MNKLPEEFQTVEQITNLFEKFGKIINCSVWKETKSAKIIFDEKESAIDASKGFEEELLKSL